MKKIYLFILFLPLLFAYDSDPFYNSSGYYPVLMERPQLEKSILYREAQTIKNPGKIYYKDQVIYLVEKYKGIHVIDNSNPENPHRTGFINVPGCIDLAIKNNSLFADNSIDLVAINISNGPEQLQVTQRIKNVFPEPTPPGLDFIPHMFQLRERPENTIIVGWEKLNN